MTNPDSPLTAGLGGTIGARVAAHLTRSVASARLQLGPHQAAIAQKIMQDFTNHVSDEIRGVMGPLWNQIADSTDSAPWLRDLARKLGNERGQAWMWVAGTSTSLAMGGGLGLLLSNELQPAIGPLIRGNPHIPFAPPDAAVAVARGLSTEDFAYGDAGQGGLSRGRFRTLVDLNTITLAGGEIMELLGKGWITEKEAAAYFARAGWEPNHARELFPLQRTWISPRDGGSMLQRSIVDMKQLREIVIRNGHHPSDADKYAELAGEPLPLQDLLAAQRRGIIDQARARRGWVQGPIRNEWFDVGMALQYAPMSTVDAADSVNQGHLPLPRAQEVAAWNGLMPEHFAILVQNAGLPPGVELATEAWNRDLITEAQFTDAFLESRLKNKYVPLYKALRWRVVPQETVRRMYRLGRLTRAQALERLKWAGFDPETRIALLDAEDANGQESTRELTKSEIVGLYADRAVDVDTARGMLTDLGYPAEEVEWLIAIADLRKARRYADAVTARVRAGYVAYRLTESEAASIMDRLRIPPDQRDDLIGLWDLERLATTRGLTPAQIKAAFKKNLIDQAGAVERLIQQGYSTEDAELLLII